MIKKNILLIGLLILLVFSFTLNAWLHSKLPQTAYVDIHQLFENFSGTKELKAKLTYFENQQKTMLDSMGMKIRTLQATVDKDAPRAVLAKLESQQQNYLALSREFSQQYNQQDQEYTDMIWKQINQYLNEYGEQQGYDYIYGANGDGAMMYANDKKNITQSVIEYINLKYEGI